MSKLVIIRGNSGSGKSTTAKILRDRLGRGTMLVSQDTVRREILKVLDQDDNPAIDLIYEMCMFGSKTDRIVILEGILNYRRYSEMLQKLQHDFNGEVLAFYFNIPFEETLRRHATKANAHEFGEAEMREWWKENDFLGWKNEEILDETLSQTEIVDLIFNKLNER